MLGDRLVELDVVEVYCRVPDPSHPVVCMDETSVQCIREVRDPIPTKVGQSERYDAEFERNGVAHLMVFYAPFENCRRLDVADNHAAEQWAEGVRRLVQEDYPQATRITLVMDNLNTHTGASLYPAPRCTKPSRRLWRVRCWINKNRLHPQAWQWAQYGRMRISILSRQCLDRRLPDIEKVASEVQAWTKQQNQSNKPVDWRFTTEEARIKLKRLYPKLSN